MSGAAVVKTTRPELETVIAGALFPAISVNVPDGYVTQWRVEVANVAAGLNVATEPDVVIPDDPTATVSAVPKACTELDDKLPICKLTLTNAVQSEAVSRESVPDPLAMDSLKVSRILLVTETPVASVVGLTDERVGAPVSIVTDNAEDREDVLPVASACTVVINHTPSASDGNVHVDPDVLPDI